MKNPITQIFKLVYLITSKSNVQAFSNYLFLSIICIAFENSKAQSFWPTTNPQGWEFATGAGTTAGVSLPPTSLDLRWHASFSNTGLGPKAIVVNSSGTGFPCYWSQPTPGVEWISVNPSAFGAYSCSSDPADYSCLPSAPPVYFTYTFVLPSTPAIPVFAIDWIIFADGWVQKIEVNGITAWDSYNLTGIHSGDMTMGMKFKWCKFQPGLNKIQVQVNNGATSNSTCKRTGLKVHSFDFYANYVNYAFNYTYSNTVSGSTLVCPNKPFSFSVPNGTAGLYPSGNSTTWSWQVPSSWPSPGSFGGNVYSGVSSGTNSGLIGVMGGSIQGVGTHTNFVCLSKAVFSVTVPNPPNISTTSSVVCNGNCAVLTATGGGTYAWYSTSSIPFSTNNSVNICPTQNTTYNVIIHTNPGNCAVTRSVYVPVGQSPMLIINSSPTVICQGMGVSLWAGGNAPTYTWFPVNSSAGSIIDYPLTTTVYTLIGKSIAGCTTVKTKTIIVNPTPVLVASASPSVLCMGNSSNLSVTGATSYTWVPGNQNAPNITVSPTVSTIYTVTGAFGTGCSKSEKVQVLVNPVPTVVVSPPSICPGISNTLTATGGNSYTWTLYGLPQNTVLANQNPIIIGPLTNSLVIDICGSGANGCIKCTTMTLTPGTPIPLTVNDLTLCTSATPCTTISVTSTLTSFTNTWSAGVVPTNSSVVVCPTVSSVYQVSVTPTGTIGCPNTASLAVTVQTNCCGASTVGLTKLTNLNGPIYSNNSYLIDQSMSLGNSVTFQDAEVWITPGVQITVPSTKTLTLDHAHLFACSNVMWQGIMIQDGGAIRTPSSAISPSNSMIEDAIVAIELDNIVSQPTGTYSPIVIEGVIFNKNRIGVRISNAVSTVTAFGVGISGCIFTSRDMPFSTYLNPPMSWPSSAMTGTGLKSATNPTTGLFTPYTFPGMIPANLKIPYAGQPGHIGIQIENIGDPSDVSVGVGRVDIGLYPASSISGDFNLFDWIGTGIEVTNAGLRTNKAVFQSMQVYPILIGTTTVMYGGNGIDHRINSLINTNLELNTAPNSAPFGGRFWDCVKGINAENVFRMYINNSVFRSTQHVANWLNPYTLGAYGIHSNTNRFHYYLFDNEFNNVRYGFSLNTPNTPINFDVGNGPTPGVFAEMIYLERNYFGPEVASNIPYTGLLPNTSEYMDEAIQIITPNTTGWTNTAPANFTLTPSIIHNKIDRAYRGVHIEGLEAFPLAVDGNSIHIEDDYTYGTPGNPAFGYGIGIMQSIDNKSVLTNTISGIQSIPISNISAVYARTNFGNSSPNIHCNYTRDCNYGFHFDGPNNSTIWEGNHMCNEWAGLAFSTNGVISQQGNSIFSGGNGWDQQPANPGCDDWGVGNPAGSLWQTYMDNSDALNSPLYVENIIPYDFPTWNGSNNGLDYSQPGAIVSPAGIVQNPSNIDCAQNNSGTVPSWRTSQNQNGNENSGLENETIIENKIQIYPNPTYGLLYINFKDESFNCKINIINTNGQVMQRLITNGGNEFVFDLSILAPSVYLIEINNSKEIFRKRLIKVD